MADVMGSVSPDQIADLAYYISHAPASAAPGKSGSAAPTHTASDSAPSSPPKKAAPKMKARPAQK
jgi:hypothetical protein